MKGPPISSFFGGKSSFQRHVESVLSRETKKHWPEVDVVTQVMMDILRQSEKTEIERLLHKDFLQAHELSFVVKQMRKVLKLGKKEYYAVLEQDLKSHCVDAMKDVMEERFSTMRKALLHRLGELGIELGDQHAV